MLVSAGKITIIIIRARVQWTAQSSYAKKFFEDEDEW